MFEFVAMIVKESAKVLMEEASENVTAAAAGAILAMILL